MRLKKNKRSAGGNRRDSSTDKYHFYKVDYTCSKLKKPRYHADFSCHPAGEPILIACDINRLKFLHRLGSRCLLIEEDPSELDLSLLTGKPVWLLSGSDNPVRQTALVAAIKEAAPASIDVITIKFSGGEYDFSN